MLLLQLTQAAHEIVIFSVGDLRLVEDIVQVLMPAQLTPQFRDFLCRIFHVPLNYNLTRNPEKTP